MAKRHIVDSHETWTAAKLSVRPGEEIVVIALGEDLVYKSGDDGELTGPTRRPSDSRPTVWV